MTNGEKYKTTKERSDALLAWCRLQDKSKCQTQRDGYCFECSMRWLDLEAEEDKTLPCPFCGGEAKEGANFGGVHFVVCECGYSSTETSDKESAIAAHNRVAKAVMESEVK